MKKLFISLLMVIFLVGTVSASWEIDNTLSYENDDMTAVLKNWFGLTNLGNVTLSSHISPTQVRNVMPGRDRVVMYYDFKGWNQYENGLGDVTFTNEKTGEILNKAYYFAKAIYKDINTTEYETVCEDLVSVNGTSYQECRREFVKYDLVKTFIRWEKLETNDIPQGNNRIALITNVGATDKIDGIWTIAGKKISKHAVWESSLEASLLSYYKLDRTTGNVVDWTGNNTGTNFGATRGVTGILTNAFDFETGEGDYVQIDNGAGSIADITDGNLTINMWVKLESAGIFHRLIQGGDDAFSFNTDTSNPPKLQFSKIGVGGAVLSTDTVSLGAFHMVTVTYDKDRNIVQFYIDNVTDTGGEDSFSLTFTANTPYHIGRTAINNDTSLDGIVDEVGIWLRVLSAAERANLYNNGVGVSPPIAGPIVTIIHPQNITYNTTQTQLNYTVDANGVRCWYSTDGGATNLSENDCASNFTGLSTIEGLNTWTVYSNDSGGVVGTDRIFFTVNSTIQIYLISPADNFQSSNSTIDIECNAVDNLGLTNLTLVLNGVDNITNSTPFYKFDGTGDYVSFTGIGLGTNHTVGHWVKMFNFEVNKGVSIGRNTNNYAFYFRTTNTILHKEGTSAITFTSPDTLIKNRLYHVVITREDTSVNLYIDGVLTDSPQILGSNNDLNVDTIGGAGVSRLFNGTIDEVRLYNTTLTQTEVTNLFNQGREETLGSVALPNLVSLWHLGKDGSDDSRGSYDGTINGATPFIELRKTLTLADATYNWTCRAWDSDSFVKTFTPNRTFIITDFLENNVYYNATTAETAYETFTVNITSNGTTPSSASLIYNAVEYTGATVTNAGANYYNISKTITIPNSPGVKSFNFNFSLGSTEFATSTQTQEVYKITFNICNATYPIPYVNFSFKDESDLTTLNASNDLTDVNYWIGDNTNMKSYIFNNNTPNLNYTFCFSPPNRTVTTDIVFKYSRTGYPLRTFAFDDAKLTNTTTQKVLYLLATANGIYSSINVIESSGSVIPGVAIQVERQFAGVWTIISQDTTGSDGTATFWLNPNFQHRITATKTGYVTNQVTITPGQTFYTLTLQRVSGDAEYTSDLPGIKWVTYPQSGTIDIGTRNFNVTVTSSESNLENCKFELVNATNLTQILGTSTSFTNSSYCFMNINYNAQAGIKFFGRLSLDTDTTTGFVIVNADWKWIVIDIDAKAWRTMTSFFSDLKTLSEFGEGNEAEFSRIVTFFLIATIIFGVFIYFSGIELTSPGITILLIWGITFFASAGGFLTFDSGSSNVNTIMEQWGFFFIFTIYMLNYFLTVIRRANE